MDADVLGKLSSDLTAVAGIWVLAFLDVSSACVSAASCLVVGKNSVYENSLATHERRVTLPFCLV